MRHVHPVYGETIYKRWWRQKIDNFNLTIENPNGTTVKAELNGQEADMPESKEILDAISTAVKGVL